MEAIIEALGFNPWTFLFQVANVVLILLALYFILWKPLTKSFNNREQKIEEDIREATSAREKAEEILATYQEKNEQAHQEAQAILERSVKMAEATRLEIVAQAEEEAARTLEQARQEIEREKRLAMANLRSQAADLVLTATSKVLARTLTSGDQEYLAREALAEVERLQ